MSVLKSLRGGMQYLFEAFARIFSPSDDRYPTVGENPFEGEPYEKPLSAK